MALEKKIAIVGDGFFPKFITDCRRALECLDLDLEKMTYFPGATPETLDGMLKEKFDLMLVESPLVSGLYDQEGKIISAYKVVEHLTEKLRSEGENKETPIVGYFDFRDNYLNSLMVYLGADESFCRDQTHVVALWKHIGKTYFNLTEEEMNTNEEGFIKSKERIQRRYDFERRIQEERAQQRRYDLEQKGPEEQLTQRLSDWATIRAKREKPNSV
jgi:hypothetical protein